MNYQVAWRADILDVLAEIYVSIKSDQRHRMADGIEALNGRLADDPLSVGESREGAVRIAFPPLLVVRFRVNEQTRIVRIVGVGKFGR